MDQVTQWAIGWLWTQLKYKCANFLEDHWLAICGSVILIFTVYMAVIEHLNRGL